MNKIILAAALVALSAGTAQAATGNAASTTGSANATVITSLKIAHTAGAGLAFGTFSAGTGGTIVVSQTGAGSVTGDVGLMTTSSNAADGFTRTGDTTRSFAVTTSTGNTVTTGGTTPSTMAFAVSAPATATLAAGAYSLKVGGTLAVASAQPVGSYTGTYTVTIAYQ